MKEKRTNVELNKSVSPYPKTNVTQNDRVTTFSGISPLNPGIILPTILVEAQGKDGIVGLRALLDTGSTANFVTVSASRKLNLKVSDDSVTLSINTLHGKHTANSRKIACDLVDKEGREIQISAFEVDKVMTTNHIDLPDDEELRHHLKNKTLNENFPRPPCDIELLIGVGDLWKIVHGVNERLGPDLVVLKTRFGNVVCGLPEEKVVGLLSGVDLLNKQIDRMISIEELPHDNDPTNLTRDEILAVEKMEENLRFDDSSGRFVTRLLWRGKPDLRNNYASAKQRLDSLIRRLKKDPVRKQAYMQAVLDLIDQRVVETVDEESQVAMDPARTDVYYLPHRDVFDPLRDTTKLRVVFDASATTGTGKSLNDCLLPGPPLQQKVAAIVMRFRTKKIALIGDCQKMFLQVGIEEADRDFIRFLWKDPDDPDGKVQIFRFTKLIFGATDSPFQAISCLQRLVRNKLKEKHLSALEKRVCETIQEDTYVDDITTGGNTVNDAIDLYKGLKGLLDKAKFKIHKWASNSPEVLRHIPEKEKATVDPKTGISKLTKSLGVRWDPYKDLLLFTGYEDLHESNDDTKRAVASLLASLYDPGGLISPFILQAREVMKETHVKKMGWKDSLPDQLKPKWHKWVSDIKDIGKVSFPRYVPFNHDTQIHIFGDASGRIGYGIAVYCRTWDSRKKKFESNLLMARSKINPKKELTIPRLELTAALLCTQTAEMIHRELKLPKERFFCWSDSEIVLWWLQKQPDHLVPFVANRIEKIQQGGFPFFYIDTANNPADICSRGGGVEELNSSLWKKGPAFLQQQRESWPQKQADFKGINLLEGVKKQFVYSLSAIVTRVPGMPNPVPLHSRYYDHNKMLYKTAVIFHVINHWRAKVSNKNYGPYQQIRTHDFIEKAHFYWIRQAQNEHFGKEIASLANEEPIPTDSPLRTLNPHLDDKGLIRVGGRLGEAPLPETAKFPIILPKGHGFTTSLIRMTHVDNEHAGADWLHFHLRQFYWIMSSRQQIRTIIRNCFLCQKYNAVRGNQQMAPLPRDRLSVEVPFSIVGVDYTGELKIKMTYRSTKIVSAYLAIFTCLTTRAVHLEVVLSNDTEDFIMAFKRMASTRGLPSKVYSDNALQFKRANKEIVETVLKNNEKIVNLTDKYKFKWYFAVEYHSAGSGVWERQVKSVKQPLRKVLGDALVTYTELMTIVKEIEAHVNDRPLAQASETAFEVITPSMLCIGRKLRPWNDKYAETEFPQEQDVRDRWAYRQKLVKSFFQSWVKQYVLSLQQRHKWRTPKPNLKEGDLVLVELSKVKRHKWPLARVKEVILGRDGLVRSVHLQSQGHQGVITRSVNDIFPLEISTERRRRENVVDALIKD